MDHIHLQIEDTWRKALNKELVSPYFYSLQRFLAKEKENYPILPPEHLIFNAFNHTPLPNVKVVLLGQDPYPQPGLAHGLCFSVPDGMPLPPSLQNIFKELTNDTGLIRPVSGNLTRWAQQGILLLNATLTVRAHSPGSHRGKGWEKFTDATIKTISQNHENIVFLLWGQYAQKKAAYIDSRKHLIMKAAHPSPQSATKGFFGCRHFSKANDWLEKHAMKKIAW